MRARRFFAFFFPFFLGLLKLVFSRLLTLVVFIGLDHVSVGSVAAHFGTDGMVILPHVVLFIALRPIADRITRAIGQLVPPQVRQANRPSTLGHLTERRHASFAAVDNRHLPRTVVAVALFQFFFLQFLFSVLLAIFDGLVARLCAFTDFWILEASALALDVPLR